MIRTGFAKEIVTPPLGVPLCGYFVPRPNDGAYDDLCVRALVFADGGGRKCAILSADLCFISANLADRCRKAMADMGITFTDDILFSATHSHTAPYPDRFFGDDPDEAYLDLFAHKSALAVKRAEANLAGCELHTAKGFCDTLAFNRRYWMKNGTVVTNPGKLNPDVVRPEGPVDYDIPILAFMREGKIAALIVNIVNHTDTIDGNTVSADWPGRMEKELQHRLGYDLPVIMLLGASGNINHFDPNRPGGQSSYAEAVRIGKGYADAVEKALVGLKKQENADSFAFVSGSIDIPCVDISDAEAAEAQAILDKPFDGVTGNMTAVGLAKGEGAVARFFASQLLDFRKNGCGKTYSCRLVSIRFGTAAAIVSMPGEPFTEIGLAVKEASRFPVTLVSTLSMAECGYIPLPECFGRGGYEVLPVEGGGVAHDTAPRLIEAASALVR